MITLILCAVCFVAGSLSGYQVKAYLIAKAKKVGEAIVKDITKKL